MSNVANLLKSKGCQVVTIEPEASVLQAARLMNMHHIGSLVVVEEGRPLGMFTERDVLTRVVAAERSPSGTRVREVMTTRVLTCTPDTSLDAVRHTIRSDRVRHIPVVEDGKLCGMVSIGDLNTAEVKVLAETISYLEQYTYRG
jgi:CBS domain-containing protein